MNPIGIKTYFQFYAALAMKLIVSRPVYPLVTATDIRLGA